MGLVKSDLPKLITAGLKTQFMKGQKDVSEAIYKKICTEIKSTKSSETYAWLGSSPKMKAFKDERQPEGLLEHDFSLKNLKYEASIHVDQDAIDDEQYGQIKIRVRQMGEAAEEFYDERLVEVIESNPICYDGQNFFDTDHQEGDSAAQSNAPAAHSDYAVATAADFVAVAKLVFPMMRKFKDDKNRPAKTKPSHVMVNPDQEWTAREAFDKEVVNPAQTGASAVTMKGKLEVLVGEDLTAGGTPANDPVYWLDCRKALKPFIFQNRMPTTFTAVDQANSYEKFMRDGNLYGVKNRFNMGVGNWRQAIKTTGA